MSEALANKDWQQTLAPVYDKTRLITLSSSRLLGDLGKAEEAARLADAAWEAQIPARAKAEES